MHEEEEESGYVPEPIDPGGGYLTIRPVYEDEAEEYVNRLIQGDKHVNSLSQGRTQEPPIQFVAPSDEQPTSLREELEAMGWFTDM